MNTSYHNQYLETAWDIGTKLLKSSIWHENKKCNWQGGCIELIDGEYKAVTRTFGADLYLGTSGIAFFLAALYSQTKDQLLLKTVEGAVEQIKTTMQHLPEHGFYSGKPGAASAIIGIGKLLQREEWIQEAMHLLHKIKTENISPLEIDIISGISGSISLLIDVYKEYKQDVFMDKAIKMGEILCDQAKKEGNQWSWVTVPGSKALTGFSHGASGIAMALFQLYGVTGNSKYLTGALNSINYEQQQFSHLEQNWPDYRNIDNSTGKSSYGYAWCHGAPGIALARIEANKILPDRALLDQAKTALKTTAINITTTLTNNFQSANYSLCHGVAGNADILLESDDLQYQQLAEHIGNKGINYFKDNRIPWPGGLPSITTPGMMMGLAGTGYFYLRLYDPKKFKTVLMPKLLSL